MGLMWSLFFIGRLLALYMARVEVKSRHKNACIIKKLGPFARNIDTDLSSIVNVTEGSITPTTSGTIRQYLRM
jgi:hypothetical protein